MLDTKLLRENFDEVKESLANRGFDLDKNHFDEIDKQRKSLQIEVENLQSERKKLSSEYGERKKSGQDTEEIKSKVDSINTTLKDKEDELNNYLEKLNDFLMGIPNIPDDSVPTGSDENDNVVINKFGEISTKNDLDHLEITNEIDTELAAKLAGSRFAVLKGEIAKAYIVLKEGEQATEEEMIAFCREELAAYKCPRKIQFVMDVPKTSTGKIMRRELTKLDSLS